MGIKLEVKIEGLERVNRMIQRSINRVKPFEELQTEIGYTQTYALIVHEDLEVYHPYGQAKYLEMPSRRYRSNIYKVIAAGLGRGLSFQKSLLEGCEFLRQTAIPFTPIDTGALRLSTYISTLSKASVIAAKTFAVSEAHRLSVLAARSRNP